MPEPFVAQLGRISGKLLTENLLRNGVDLTFRNAPTDADLLYLDVNNSRIGINSNPPDYELDIAGDSRVSANVIVNGTQAEVDNLIFYTSGTISTTVGPIIIEPNGAEAYVQYGKILTPDFEIKDNYIRGIATNADITLDAAGTGKVNILASTDITGNLAVVGNISATGEVRLDGQFIVGDSPIDTVTISPDFTQSIIPGLDGTYDLGKNDKRWSELHIYDINGVDNINTVNLFISDQMKFTANTISTIQSNDNLIVDSATGTIRIENISINAGVINNFNNTPITISHTGTGYLTINDTNAFRIPYGTTAERTPVEVGATRWNSEIGYMECFDGTIWQVATGGGIVITAPIMEELGHVYTLIFG
jgi:hypothetical protein